MENHDYPKVLVISHNPFSDSQNNGKTLTAFFDGWPSEKLAQVFITGHVTDLTLCNNYFEISEKQMLKRVFNKNISVGNKCSVIDQQASGSQVLPLGNSANRVIKGLSRDLLWSFGFWKTESLIEWINEFNPDIVFYQSSSDSFMFDFVKYICVRREIPMIMETTDDYLSLKKPVFPLSLIHHVRLVKRYKYAVLNSYCVFAISKTMADEYESRFGGNFKVAMNCVKSQQTPIKNSRSDIIKIVYAGNLALNRWKVLAKIGLYLKDVKDVKVDFSIYSLESPTTKIKEALTIKGVMGFKGSANKQELDQIMNEADLLVHVESFDKSNKHVTRLSISTKIPEYLQTKRPILAIGPSDIASIKYLKENDLAFVISELDKTKFMETIGIVLADSNVRNQYALKSYEFAQKNHNIELIRKSIQDAIFQALYTN